MQDGREKVWQYRLYNVNLLPDSHTFMIYTFPLAFCKVRNSAVIAIPQN